MAWRKTAHRWRPVHRLPPESLSRRREVASPAETVGNVYEFRGAAVATRRRRHGLRMDGVTHLAGDKGETGHTVSLGTQPHIVAVAGQRRVRAPVDGSI